MFKADFYRFNDKIPYCSCSKANHNKQKYGLEPIGICKAFEVLSFWGEVSQANYEIWKFDN